MFELTQIVSQENVVFQETLNCIREGIQTLQDVRMLQATEHAVPLTQPHLMYKNADRDQHNASVIQHCAHKGLEVHRFTAMDQALGVKLSSAAEQQHCNCHDIVNVVQESRVATISFVRSALS